MLTRLIPRLAGPLGHRLARLLGLTDVHSMFCPCAPCGEADDLW